MLTLWNQFDDLFGNDDLWRWPVRTAERRFLPSVDIRETENAYVLAADVPGVPTENIDVNVKDGVLTLTGERKAESRTSEAGYHRVERVAGKFQRSFVLPKGVKADAIEARVEHGVLTVTIPKPVAAVPHRVTIQVGDGHEHALPAEGEHKAG